MMMSTGCPIWDGISYQPSSTCPTVRARPCHSDEMQAISTTDHKAARGGLCSDDSTEQRDAMASFTSAATAQSDELSQEQQQHLAIDNKEKEQSLASRSYTPSWYCF